MSQRGTSPAVPLKKVPPAVAGDYRPAILVVDDESAIADTLTQILCRNGYRAMAAYDGTEALEAALLTPPELLIADVILPGMNGIELGITIKRIFPDCKILLFSGQAAAVDLLCDAKIGGHDFTLLAKPVHPDDLLSRISATFRPWEARVGSAVG